MKIINYFGYSKEVEYHNRMLYVMVGISVVVAAFFLTIYFLFIPFTPAIITHILYIGFSISLYWFLKCKKYIFVKYVMIISFLIQLTLAVFIWFPIETGYNLYYFMVPMVGFLVVEFNDIRQGIFMIIASLLSTFLYLFSEIQGVDNYMYETSNQMNQFLSATSILYIFLPMILIFAIFSNEIYKSHKQLRLNASTDFLTRTLNRRVLFESGEMEIKKAKASESIFSLIIFDIDHFKKVNDQHGHLAGDELLRKLTGLVMKYTRKNDIFSRFGGEEFAILLRETIQDEAEIMANHLLHLIQETRFIVDGIEIYITVSIGVVQYRNEFNEFKQVMKAADNALYKAKNNGRNQVVIDGN